MPPQASGRWSPRPTASGKCTSLMLSWFALAISRSPTYHWLFSQVSPASAVGWAGAAPQGFTQHPWFPLTAFSSVSLPAPRSPHAGAGRILIPWEWWGAFPGMGKTPRKDAASLLHENLQSRTEQRRCKRVASPVEPRHPRVSQLQRWEVEGWGLQRARA